jgi:hypothetical protein
MDRVNSYIKAGKVEEVRTALAAKNISTSTLRNWLKNPTKAFTAYRWSEFVDAINKLPDLEREKRNQAYEFALTELGIGREGQHEIGNYHGNYRVFHDFEGVKLDNLAIRVEAAPFVAIFAFKYRNRDGQQGYCDGLIICRHGRLIFTGFSPSTTFQAVFRCVAFPNNDLIRGMAFIEDLNTHEICFSEVALVQRQALSETDRSEAEEFVRGSGRPL